MKETLREKLARQMPDVRFSFEPADIVSEVMSFGSVTPIEIAARSANLAENRKFIGKVQAELVKIPAIRDVQVSQSLDYPTVDVQVDREKAGISGVTLSQVAKSVVALLRPLRRSQLLARSQTGIGYQVRVELPQPVMRPQKTWRRFRSSSARQQILLRDVASRIARGQCPASSIATA
jgi:multidrug efflux pump subunit AcrB